MLKTGKCSNCLEVDILDYTKKGKERIMPEYREHVMELSNGGSNSLMSVGVCTACKIKLVQGEDSMATAENILKNHVEYWKANASEKEMPPEEGVFSVVDPNSSEEKFIAKKVTE